jgi:hypothetical protein
MEVEDLNRIVDWARSQHPILATTIFCVVNVFGTSVFPLPIGVWMMVIAGILYGLVGGLAIYLSTSLLGAWITFLVVRLVRQRVISLLGPHADTWRALDAAIMQEGLWYTPRLSRATRPDTHRHAAQPLAARCAQDLFLVARLADCAVCCEQCAHLDDGH